MDDPAMFKKLFQEQIIDAGWIQDPSTLAIIISFFIYNPNTYLAQEKKLAIEFLTPGLFINLEHSMSMVNTKLYRNDAQTAVSTIAIVLGFVLVGLSLYQVHLEEADRKLAADVDGEGEEGEAPAGDKKEDDKKDNKEEEEDEENKSMSFGELLVHVKSLIVAADRFQ